MTKPRPATPVPGLASPGVAFADDSFADFGDGPDEDPAQPLLPKEDRIWRHPSELGAAEQPFVLDPAVVRRRWLSSQPSRASAWTAGLVGAILATGIVVLGTHLASAFTAASTPDQARHALRGAAEAPTVTAVSAPSVVQVSSSVSRSIGLVSSSTAVVETSIGGRDSYADALVVGNGALVVPLSAVEGSPSLLVTMPGSTTSYPGQVVAMDPASQLALIRINDVGRAQPARFDLATPLPGAVVIGLGRPGATAPFAATIDSVATSLGPGDWPVAVVVDVPANRAPLGSPLIDTEGQVIGIVAGGTAGGHAVEAVPAWLAAPVARSLAAYSRVVHGWLGLVCGTDVQHGQAAGAKVESIGRNSPATGLLEDGDVITAIDGSAVTSYQQLESRLYSLAPNEVVHLSVERGKLDLALDVRLSAAA